MAILSKHKLVYAAFIYALAFWALPSAVWAQEAREFAQGAPEVSRERTQRVSLDEDRVFRQARALSAWQIVSENARIHLWGVEPIENNDPIFRIRSRTALEDKIGDGQVTCTVKAQNEDHIVAQCTNSAQEDLSLFMLQRGFVLASRSVIYGTIFEKPYITAEEQAQSSGEGLWRAGKNVEDALSGKSSRNFLLAALLFLAAGIIGLGFISFYIMRGFRRVVDVQNKTIDLAVKERHLKDKERFIIASMLDSEVRENKSKIDAYLVVYEEVLRDLKDPARMPKYRKSGDIVQKQPALGRSVFDGNTDRLDLMGQYLASDIIHYYARIKTVPDYVDLEPETSVEEAQKIVATAVDNAKKLNDLSDNLMRKFIASGLVKRGEQGQH